MRQALLALALIAVTAGSALASDERRWTFREDEEGASLSFAIPDSDDAGPFFYCQRGEGKIGVVMFIDRRLAVGEPTAEGQWRDAAGQTAPWPATMKIWSGKAVMIANGTANADEMNGGSQIEVKVRADAFVMAEFARTGVIRVESFSETTDMPKAPTGRVRALVAACKKS